MKANLPREDGIVGFFKASNENLNGRDASSVPVGTCRLSQDERQSNVEPRL